LALVVERAAQQRLGNPWIAVSGVLNSCETLATKSRRTRLQAAQFRNVMQHQQRR